MKKLNDGSTEKINDEALKAVGDETTQIIDGDKITSPTESEGENVEKPKRPAVKPKKAVVEDIPAHIDHILSLFPDYDELYVDAKGGVYPKDTKPELVGDAILYKNKYKQ